ncbi:MAG: hypothetical protein JXP72_08345 [Coriobacteriia bacterium]|nr:hypothetical protein [Coriobacteriia bacterium]
MPELAFVQVIAVGAVVALVGIIVAIPTGARLGSRPGRRVLRASGLGLVVLIAGCLFWGASTGELATFNRQLGLDGWLQIGAFFGIILSTGYRFVGRYLDDRARSEKRAADEALERAGDGSVQSTAATDAVDGVSGEADRA